MNTHARNSAPTGSASWWETGSRAEGAARPFTNVNSTVVDPHSPVPPLISPSIVDKYVILEQGQAGGMGIVYKARDAKLDRIVALKVIKGGAWATDEENARFHREAQAAARLHHPNIIPLYESGQEHGCPYFTMAFAAGGNLAQHRGRFTTPRDAAALLETIARAVHHAHQRGILHRDLKPANILFDDRGTPLVSDFGLAKFIDVTLELTRPGELLGTPSYMSPEQASGQSGQVSEATDVWALGVMLYELVTGQQPFQGGSHEEALRKVRTLEPPRPRSLNRSLDPALETVIGKCLEKEPSRRYASAEALADDLARWLRGDPVTAQPPSWRFRTGRALRRYRTPALRVGYALVLLVLLALAWRGVPPSVPPPVEEGDRKAMEDKLAQLKRGEKVTLLGESEKPVWWRWQSHLGPDNGARLERDRVFRVYAGRQPSMLELLPSAPKRYRLRAEVQNINSRDVAGKVGIYFAHGKRATKEVTTHCFFRVDFNDRIPTFQPRNKNIPPQGQVHLMLPIYREMKGPPFFTQAHLSAGSGRQFAHAGQIEPMPWRKLKVEVTPEWVKTFWEGELIKTRLGGVERDGVDPKEAQQKVSRIWQLAPHNPKVQIVLGEGIGLYVERAVAAFRSVEIEPLPQK